MLKELATRDNAGIKVELLYDEDTDEVQVTYADIKENVFFTLDPPKFLAFDAYKHPIVYFDAALNGVYNPNRLNPDNVEAYVSANPAA